MKSSNFNWGPASFILGYHLILLLAVPAYLLYYTPSWGMLITSAALMYITGLSVTAGYHRLYSHLTYKISPVVEAVLLFFATMATQGSALRWSFDHRHHHAFVDTDRDPYSIKKGFWYAHFLWLLEKPKPIEDKVVADLLRNRLLQFQHRFYGLLMVATNLITVLFVGWCFNDYLGAFVFAWLVRLFFLHHFTWFINSLAHTWGAATFCQELSAMDNYFISLFTFGEGYHNYHHTFAYDYRNGIRWYHFDPTKWLIWTLKKLGLAHNLRKNEHFFIEKKILLNRKQVLLDKLQTSFDGYKEVWEQKVTELSESLVAKLGEMQQLRDLYRKVKEAKEEQQENLVELKSKIKAAKKDFKKECRYWMALSREVMARSSAATAPRQYVAQDGSK